MHVPLSRHHWQFLATNSSPSSRSHFSTSSDLAHQSEYARSRALFEPTLQAYEEKAGVSLTQHPFTIKLQSCDTVEAITGLLQDQAQEIRHFQGSDKVMGSIKIITSIICKMSSTASLAGAFGLVCQRGLMTCFTSLTFLHRHSRLRRRYWLVSLSYLTYVPVSSSYVDGLVTSL